MARQKILPFERLRRMDIQLRKEEKQALEILKSYAPPYSEYIKSERPDFILPSEMRGLEVTIACDQTGKYLSNVIHTQIQPKPETKIYKNDQVKAFIEERDASALFIDGCLWVYSKPIDLTKSTETIWNAILQKLDKLKDYSEKCTFFELFIFDETDVININDFQNRVKEIFCRYKQKYVKLGDSRKYQTIFIYNKNCECLGVISVDKPTALFANIPCSSIPGT